jgi:hypothetical protein
MIGQLLNACYFLIGHLLHSCRRKCMHQYQHFYCGFSPLTILFLHKKFDPNLLLLLKDINTFPRYIHQNPVKAGIVTKPHHWRWSSCRGYYGQSVYPPNLLDPYYLLRMFSPDLSISQARFKDFNERTNQDKCLEDYGSPCRRLSDDQARIEIKKCLGNIEIPQLKSLQREKRNVVLRKVKRI